MTQTTTQAPATTNAPTTTTTATDIKALDSKATLAEAIAKINELVAKANTKRDRGPESQRDMTEDDAKRVILGDLKDAKCAKAAETLGLSYGQVYSARKGFTFKTIAKEGEKLAAKK